MNDRHIGLYLSGPELVKLQKAKKKLGVKTDADVLRIALQRLFKELGIDC